MGDKPKMFEDEPVPSAELSDESTLGLNDLSVLPTSPPVDPEFEEKKAMFAARLSPMVFGSLPASIGEFTKKYNEYLRMFAPTIKDDTQRRETAIMMARKDVQVGVEVIDEAESSFEHALQMAATEFRNTLNDKAQETVGAAGKRSEQITGRRKAIKQQIAALNSEDGQLLAEFEGLKTTASQLQADLAFKQRAFDAAFSTVETEGEEMMAELRKMLAQEANS